MKFMNAELIAIRDNLVCGHCQSVFQGSDSQAYKVKYSKATVYCSSICSTTAVANKLRTPIPNRGPCKTCGNTFFSRTSKMYCSMSCYLKSEQFKAQLARNRENLTDEAKQKAIDARKTGETIPCLECGTEIYQKKSRARKFCKTTCYRSYMAKRFDRWIANPQGMALPQCYDEFLDQRELKCVIEGCDWHGKHLSMHINQAHGVPREEFKRAAGFNLSTGVIARPLAELLSDRKRQGVAVMRPPLELTMKAVEASSKVAVKYKSLEGREHHQKARALISITPGPQRICSGCGTSFQQKQANGRALYCSFTCRDQSYSEERKKKAKVRSQDAMGRFVWKPQQ